MKKIINILILTALTTTFSFSAIVSTFAAEDQFIIGQTVSNAPDVTAPSVPTDLSATAVSQTQIDLSWTASTDSVAVTGYQIFRDSVFLATSTLTTYSDSGLTPATLYTYTVTAFDAAVNISSESAPASATTFSPSVDTGGAGGGRAPLSLRHLSVVPDTQSALLWFGTNLPAQAYVYWGKTLDYELGSIVSTIYLADHAVTLPDLIPGTHYYFKIVLIDGYERQLRVEGQEFTTLASSNVLPPENVSNFIATPSEEDITLTWNNPRTEFEKVRIVKSDKFYPRDPTDGEIIYEGRAEKYIDQDVVVGKTYYYTAFTLGVAGNFSSGSITDAKVLRPGELPTPPRLFADVIQLPKASIDPILQKFSLADIDFIQDGKKISVPVGSDRVEIRGDRNLLISVDYEKVPEILKTIAVTLHDPEDPTKTFSFLLRINSDKTAYEANVAAFGRSGEYKFSFAILDYKHQGLVSLAGTLISNMPNLLSGENEGFFNSEKFGMTKSLWLILLLVLIGILVFVLRKRSKVSSGPVVGSNGSNHGSNSLPVVSKN